MRRRQRDKAIFSSFPAFMVRTDGSLPPTWSHPFFAVLFAFFLMDLILVKIKLILMTKFFTIGIRKWKQREISKIIQPF